ncbi:MAG: hypothetical protein MZU91_11315 [Desulfosudis oleivorans]|nr:hypothetical protein [Desulfosudis oleivorans]
MGMAGLQGMLRRTLYVERRVQRLHDPRRSLSGRLLAPRRSWRSSYNIVMSLGLKGVSGHLHAVVARQGQAAPGAGVRGAAAPGASRRD